MHLDRHAGLGGILLGTSSFFSRETTYSQGKLLFPEGRLPWALENPVFRLKWKGLARHARENRSQRSHSARATERRTGPVFGFKLLHSRDDLLSIMI